MQYGNLESSERLHIFFSFISDFITFVFTYFDVVSKK